MGEERTGEPRDEPQANQRLTVAQAAVSLGITEGAVRSRIKRGTLPTVKEGGTVYVMLVDGSSEANQSPRADEPYGEPSDQSELVESLQDQLTYLRQQLEAERNAHAETRRIAYTLAQRVPELEAAQEPRESPETASEDTGRGAVPPEPEEPAERRSWLHRFFFGP
jgi:hypothetical protein